MSKRAMPESDVQTAGLKWLARYCCDRFGADYCACEEEVYVRDAPNREAGRADGLVAVPIEDGSLFTASLEAKAANCRAHLIGDDIFAIEQAVRYPADEQWLALSSDVYDGLAANEQERLRDECTMNGVGGFLVKSEGDIEVLVHAVERTMPDNLKSTGIGFLAGYKGHKVELIESNLHALRSRAVQGIGAVRPLIACSTFRGWRVVPPATGSQTRIRTASETSPQRPARS